MLKRLHITLAAFAVIPAPALAYSDVVAFGASLSDSGAFAYLEGTDVDCPPPFYSGCRFTNGPTWVENLAAAFGRSANTAYGPGGGTNYAIGGERSDELFASPSAVNGGQIPSFATDVLGVADPSALYVIYAGGNNRLQDNPTSTFPAESAAFDIVRAVTDLSAMGATDFLISNLASSDAWANFFNETLAGGLDDLSGANPHLDIHRLNAQALFLDMVLSPGSYGLTNVTSACINRATRTICSNPDEHLFWDSIHPTARGHEILAEAALAVVPEPNTALLVGMGFAVLSGSRRARGPGRGRVPPSEPSCQNV
jgi:phospholipase/lecithinase/hemolysin